MTAVRLHFGRINWDLHIREPAKNWRLPWSRRRNTPGMFVKGRFSTDFFDHFEYNRPCGLSNWRSLRAALLFCVLALIFCGATAIICPLTEYGGVLKWSKRRDSKSRRPGNWCMGSNPISSAKKKRQFSTEDCRFFLFFSLFSFHSSLFSQIVVSG